MIHRDVLAAMALVMGHGLALANGAPGLPAAPPPVVDAAAPAAGFTPDDPPDARAVAAYLADVLMPGQRAQRTPTGYAVLDPAGRVTRTVDLALTRHQCWKIKDGYQCLSTVRSTTTPTGGRARSATLEIGNDYQWRDGRLFSARLEAARPAAAQAALGH